MSEDIQVQRHARCTREGKGHVQCLSPHGRRMNLKRQVVKVNQTFKPIQKSQHSLINSDRKIAQVCCTSKFGI